MDIPNPFDVAFYVVVLAFSVLALRYVMGFRCQKCRDTGWYQNEAHQHVRCDQCEE